jgi:hypothetical protein
LLPVIVTIAPTVPDWGAKLVIEGLFELGGVTGGDTGGVTGGVTGGDTGGVTGGLTGGVTGGVNVTGTSTSVTLPATSVPTTAIMFGPFVRLTLHENVPFAATVVAVPLHVKDASPDSASEALPVTVCDEVENVLFGNGEVTVTAGGVLSMLSVTCALAETPELSFAVPVMV